MYRNPSHRKRRPSVSAQSAGQTETGKSKTIDRAEGAEPKIAACQVGHNVHLRTESETNKECRRKGKLL